MSSPHLSVLISTYRQPGILVKTLRDFGNQTFPSDAWELILLDDGSGDGTAEIATTAVPDDVPVVIKRVPPDYRENYAHAELFNELLRLSDTETERFVHVEDVRVRSDFLAQHAKWHDEESLTLVTGPLCESDTETFEPEACERWKLMQMSGEDSDAYRCGFRSIWAKSMSYSQELVSRLSDQNGPFDEDMSDWGYHEIEFAYRAEKEAGARCVYDVGCAVYHPPHNSRDEREYRGINREQRIEAGEAQNAEYICEKHGLSEHADWQIGESIERPSREV